MFSELAGVDSELAEMNSELAISGLVGTISSFLGSLGRGECCFLASLSVFLLMNGFISRRQLLLYTSISRSRRISLVASPPAAHPSSSLHPPPRLVDIHFSQLSSALYAI